MHFPLYGHHQICRQESHSATSICSGKDAARDRTSKRQDKKKGCTKIGDFGNVTPPVDAVGLQQDVAGFEVAVDNAKAVDIVHAFSYLLSCPQQCSLSV